MNKVLVYGLGLTGISSVKALDKLGYEVYTYDKDKEEIDELKGYKYSPISDLSFKDLEFEFVLKSPGIKPTDHLVKKLSQRFEIVSDVELSYRLFSKKDIIAITGTNGKTSTTSMTSHILNLSGTPAISVGNIGQGILWQMYMRDCVFVEELSSFQLHDTKTYHPHIASILNINEDHIDWHGDFEDYISSKLNIARNQNAKDYLVINADDKNINDHEDEFRAKLYKFSSKGKVDKGMYLDSNKIILNDEYYDDEYLLDVDDLNIIGNHNYENAMAAMLMTYLYGVSLNDIVKTIKTYKSMPHRLEFVANIDGVDFYNDSKATNVDSSIKAIESFDKPIIIIAGGYDKNIDYTDYVKSFKKNGKLMVIMGATKDKIKALCIKEGVDYIEAKDMEDALNKACKNSESGDVIVLSPASASWDMYKSYQQRGDHFKRLVEKRKNE